MRGLVAGQEVYSAVQEAEAILFAEDLHLAQPEEVPTGQPQAMRAEDLPGFSESHLRYRKLLGSVAVGASVETEPSAEQTMNIFEAVRAAAEGDKQAEAMLDINIATAVTEACFKYDHVTRVSMYLNGQGELMQFGQTMRDMQYNSLAYRQNRHDKLKAVTRIEALNSHCIEDLAKDGTLDDYYFIVSSLVPQDVPEQDLRREGYFLNTLTFVTQATTTQNGEVVTESGFSKGTAAPEDTSFAERMQNRFDLEAVSRVRQRLGLPPVTTTEEALQGILVHKSVLPNGVVDFMRLCDQEAAQIADVSVKSDEYYEQLVPQSQAREQSLQSVKRRVKQSLIVQADQLTSPMDAVQKVWDLTKEFIVVAAVDNNHIDERVFGAQAAERIATARQLISDGDIIAAQSILQEAVRVAVVTGCGGGAGMNSDKGSNKNNKNLNSEADDDGLADARESNQNWTWKRGVCRVDSCPTRPKTTMVGPCAVCRNCQRMFDKGIDPTKFMVRPAERKNAIPSWQDALFTKKSVELSIFKPARET